MDYGFCFGVFTRGNAVFFYAVGPIIWESSDPIHAAPNLFLGCSHNVHICCLKLKVCFSLESSVGAVLM